MRARLTTRPVRSTGSSTAPHTTRDLRERMLRLRSPFDKLRAGSRGPGCHLMDPSRQFGGFGRKMTGGPLSSNGLGRSTPVRSTQAYRGRSIGYLTKIHGVTSASLVCPTRLRTRLVVHTLRRWRNPAEWPVRCCHRHSLSYRGRIRPAGFVSPESHMAWAARRPSVSAWIRDLGNPACRDFDCWLVAGCCCDSILNQRLGRAGRLSGPPRPGTKL